MQRHLLRPADQLSAAVFRRMARPAGLSQPFSLPTAQAGPSRSFTASRISAKKAKVTPEKSSKGKVRAQDDPVESDVDTAAVTGRIKEKMDKAVSYARGIVYDNVERARGRVSPCQCITDPEGARSRAETFQLYWTISESSYRMSPLLHP
jgi:ribosome recycling factor